ncbi:head GIN domain-containing protein [Kordiimonas aquimaris]|uniref:head GIN domain-containing protein n=1 Tax=Kordiimonas aquimaris TaxID=707591 RepID=UPI0021D36B2E|nr:head GIN domain-containing protein [Kordiimonas aquimaris]
MGFPSIFGRHSTGRNVLAGVLAAGVATSVLYSVAGSATMLHDDEGERVTQTRDVATFTRIEIRGAIDLELTAGSSDQEVTVRARESRIDRVTTEVSGDTLIIDMKEDGNSKRFWNNTNVDVTINMESLRAIDVRGAVDGEFENIDSDELLIDIRGAADVDISGTCGTLTIDMKGAADIEADDLKCENVEVEVKGAGSASVYASESIDADVAGVASISVYGNPKNVKKHSGGFASISIK